MEIQKVILVKFVSESESTEEEKKQQIEEEIKGGNTPTNINKTQNAKNETKSETNAKTLGKYALLSSKGTATNAARFIINRQFSLSEEYMAETSMNNALSKIGKAVGFASSIKIGASIGSTAGPIGTALGAVIGVATWGTNQAINYQNKLNGYYQSLNATNYQTEFDRTRLGLINEGRGTEN